MTTVDTPPFAAPAPPHVSAETLSWAQTRALIRSDLARIVAHNGGASGAAQRVYYFLLPGMQAMFWFRLARHAYVNGWRNLARFISLLAMYLTRAEIPPTSSIGPSALIAHATGVHVFGRAGARVTIQGDGGLGGGFGVEDIGGGPGYPVLGDDVVVGFGAKVLGAVRLGDGVHVGPCTLVTTDVPDGGLVLWPKPRVMKGGAAAPEVRQ